jgi:hypothetical protein
LGLTISQTTVANGGSGAAQTVLITGTESLQIDTAIAAGTINASGMSTRTATTVGLQMDAGFTATAAIPGQTITGSSGLDTLRGSTGADVINAGAGNDTVHGSTGADSIDAGDGTDTYSTVAAQIAANIQGAGTGTSTGVAINLGATAVTAAAVNFAMGGTIGLSASSTSLAAGTVQYVFGTQSNFNATTTSTLTNFENITLAGDGNNYVVGSATANGIVGGGGIDIIDGGAGNDTITGGAGADIIDGGADNDVLIGGAGIDSITLAAGGSDTVVFGTQSGATATVLAANANNVTAGFLGGAGAGADILSFGTGAAAATTVNTAVITTLAFDANAAAVGTAINGAEGDVAAQRIVVIKAVTGGTLTAGGLEAGLANSDLTGAGYVVVVNSATSATIYYDGDFNAGTDGTALVVVGAITGTALDTLALTNLLYGA